MQRVYSNPDAAVAHLVRNALEGHGIEAVVRGDRLGPAVGEVPWTDAWAEVWVGDEGRLDEARAVIAEATADTGGAAEGAAWTCPACGEVGEPAFGACWKCGAERPD